MLWLANSGRTPLAVACRQLALARTAVRIPFEIAVHRPSAEICGESMNAHTRKQVLILGGGFGGLHTALELETKLARDSDVAITLINR